MTPPHPPFEVVDLPVEARILLGCARIARGADLDAETAGCLEAGVDWKALVQLALEHRVTPQLAHGLSRLPDGSAPPDIRRALEFHIEDNAQRTWELLDELFALLAELEQRGVAAIPFKGPALSAVLCGEPDGRLAGDLDLLVPREGLDVVTEVLAERGFVEETELETGRALSTAEHAWYRAYQGEYLYIRPEDGVCVEPHWALAPHTLAADLDCEGFFRRAQPMDLAGHRVLGLTLEDLLLALTVHGGKHEWTELRWICDVDELVERHPDVDAHAALGRAREHGCARILTLGLGLARDLLGTRLSDAWQAAFDADPVSDRLVSLAAGRLFQAGRRPPSVFKLSRFRWRMRERWIDRVVYALRTLTTPRIEHVRFLPLPAGLRFLHRGLTPLVDYAALPIWRRVEALRSGEASPSAELNPSSSAMASGSDARDIS
jgi:hypothetical protein